MAFRFIGFLWATFRPLTALAAALAVLPGVLLALRTEAASSAVSLAEAWNGIDVRGAFEDPVRRAWHSVVLAVLAAWFLSMVALGRAQLGARKAMEDSAPLQAPPDAKPIVGLPPGWLDWGHTLSLGLALSGFAWAIGARPPGRPSWEAGAVGLAGLVCAFLYGAPFARAAAGGWIARIVAAIGLGLLPVLGGWVSLRSALKSFDPTPLAVGAGFGVVALLLTSLPLPKALRGVLWLAVCGGALGYLFQSAP